MQKVLISSSKKFSINSKKQIMNNSTNVECLSSTWKKKKYFAWLEQAIKISDQFIYKLSVPQSVTYHVFCITYLDLLKISILKFITVTSNK
jgi:hypothetical protein